MTYIRENLCGVKTKMIIRGTTPYHSFILPILAEQIDCVYVTYLQNDKVILDKSSLKDEMEIVNIVDLIDPLDNASMEDLSEDELNSCQLTIHLSQEDTLSFFFYPAAKKNIAVIQIRLLTTDGEAFASMPINERIFGVLHDGEIPVYEPPQEIIV